MVNVEVGDGVECRYINAQDGIRVYFPPNIPIDAGEIPTEGKFDLEEALKKFSPRHMERVREIGRRYQGRQLDALSILLYAQERGRFDEFAERLEAKPEDFELIHPDLMIARTDVTAFFTELYAGLGIAPKEDAERARKLVQDYGIGVVVLPKT